MSTDMIRRFKPTKRQLLLTGMALLLIAVLSLTGILIWRHTHPRNHVPTALTQQLLFPVYDLGYLPPGFKLDTNSFQVKDNVLIFQALNAQGQNIAITEAATPTKINFTDFYKQSFSDTKNLQSEVPYTTVMGTLNTNKRHAISITPSSTWIILTSEATFSHDDAVRIVKGLRPSK